MYFRICRARFEWLVNLEIQILPAQPAQAATLTQIAMAAKRHWGYPERWMELWKPQLTFSPSYFEENESRVAEIDHAPVAFYTLLEKDGSAWLENLWVSPEYMGEGVGRQLFLHAMGLARGRGFLSMQLEADPNAVGFYEKMGMHKIGARHSQVEGQPRVLPIMEIELAS